MKSTTLAISVVCLIALTLTAIGIAQTPVKKFRVGVYDNRAIALAFFDSKLNPFVEKRKEFQASVAANDSTKMKELNEWVQKFQCKMHFQGFCRAPVDDILLLVKDQVAEVAKSTGVDMISWDPNYMNENVETVDITADLAAIFDPSDQRKKEITNLKSIEPTDLCDIKQDD